jgi:RNA polymerase sigma-70 factor (ECF subfamily)
LVSFSPDPAEPDVLVALAELDVRQRSVVVCRYLLGWSEGETAAALSTAPGTVKSRLHRANRHLSQRLAHLRDCPEEDD